MAENVWEMPSILDSLEAKRAQRRRRNQQLTFDCFKAHARGDRVICIAGHTLSPVSEDGSMYLMSVLRGTTSSECKNCSDFEGEEIK
jgi:hypothetical protein